MMGANIYAETKSAQGPDGVNEDATSYKIKCLVIYFQQCFLTVYLQHGAPAVI